MLMGTDVVLSFTDLLFRKNKTAQETNKPSILADVETHTQSLHGKFLSGNLMVYIEVLAGTKRPHVQINGMTPRTFLKGSCAVSYTNFMPLKYHLTERKYIPGSFIPFSFALCVLYKKDWDDEFLPLSAHCLPEGETCFLYAFSQVILRCNAGL